MPTRCAVDLPQLIVLLEAGGVGRRVRRDERGDACAPSRASSCRSPHHARPALRLRSDEPRAREQARVVGDLVSLDVAREEIARERRGRR